MLCGICKELLILDFREIRVDALHKEYLCKNNHKTIFRRYGYVIEINGDKLTTSEPFDITKANRSKARRRILRDILPKTSSNKAI